MPKCDGDCFHCKFPDCVAPYDMPLTPFEREQAKIRAEISRQRRKAQEAERCRRRRELHKFWKWYNKNVRRRKGKNGD